MMLINFIVIISATLNYQVIGYIDIVLGFLFLSVLSQKVLAKSAEKKPSIVDGRAVDVSNVPHQVSLERNYYPHCGGSLISNYHILTAAHCVSHLGNRNSVLDSELRVRAGTSKAGEGGIIMLVQLIRMHREYNSKTLHNDLGIIKLMQQAKLSEIIKPIALTPNWPQEGDECIVTGYGSQENSNAFYPKHTLEITRLEVFGKSECNNRFGVTMSHSELCAGNRRNKQGTCFGDSGGPLTIQGKLAGVVSSVFGCGLHATPGVYMSVRYYYDWINTCVRNTYNGAYAC